MPDLDLESLLAPIAGDAPCGTDLEYDPAFLALLEAGAGKAEQQYGDTVIPAEEPDWPAVFEQATQLAARTRDLRVAVWIVRAAARTSGWSGAVRGLQLVRGLIERHWADVHPQLDASDNDDATARMSALSPLIHGNAGLADLRAANISGSRGGITVRDIELAFGHAEPLPGESVPTESGLLQGLEKELAATPPLLDAMRAGAEAVKGIGAVLEHKLDASLSPDFTPLRKLTQRVADAAAALAGEAPAPADPSAAAAATAAIARASGAITTREDAIRALDRVCEWLERNEPSHPAPLLIRRAQRLMSKSFVDIIRDLVPDGLSQVERIAGTTHS